jgi:hypothetical protein
MCDAPRIKNPRVRKRVKIIADVKRRKMHASADLDALFCLVKNGLRTREEIIVTTLLGLEAVLFVARSSQISYGYAPHSRLDHVLNTGAILQQLFLRGS